MKIGASFPIRVRPLSTQTQTHPVFSSQAKEQNNKPSQRTNIFFQTASLLFSLINAKSLNFAQAAVALANKMEMAGAKLDWQSLSGIESQWVVFLQKRMKELAPIIEEKFVLSEPSQFFAKKLPLDKSLEPEQLQQQLQARIALREMALILFHPQNKYLALVKSLRFKLNQDYTVLELKKEQKKNLEALIQLYEAGPWGNTPAGQPESQLEDFYEKMGNILVDEHKPSSYQQALSYYEKALKIYYHKITTCKVNRNAGEPAPIDQLADSILMLHLTMGRFYQKTEQPLKAKALYEAGLKLFNRFVMQDEELQKVCKEELETALQALNNAQKAKTVAILTSNSKTQA